MEKVRFKSSLFGFKRRQVLAYINHTCADFQQQMEEQTRQHQTEKQALEQNLLVEKERSVILEKRIAELTHSLHAGEAMLAKERETSYFLRQDVQTLENQNKALEEQAKNLQTTNDTAQQQIQVLDAQILEKDALIARQAGEVTHLQDQLSRLEENFSTIRADAEQNTALVNCLNLLHGRNRALSQKAARLEAQLEEAYTGKKVEHFVRTAAAQQETVKNTENLFATVRKEIQDVLDSLSDKIESGSISESEDGNYYVDMAKL